MSGRLTKTRKVLTFFTETEAELLFSAEVADDEVYGRTLYPLSKQDWEDMGRPETITVSIEPGDRLNDGGDVFVTNVIVSDTIGGKK